MPNEITVTVSSNELAKKQEWIAERESLLATASKIQSVNNNDELDLAGSVQTAISKHIKVLEKERKAVTAPMDKVKKEVMAQEKVMRKDLESEVERLKGINSAYATKLAREEEERLERERQEAAEAEEKAAEVEASYEDNPFGDAAIFEEPEIPEVKPIEKPKLTNNKMVTRWSFEVSNANAIPREFCSPDPKKIRAYMDYQVKLNNTPSIPGVQFKSQVCVESK